MRYDPILIRIQINNGLTNITPINMSIIISVQKLENIWQRYHFQILQFLNYLGTPRPTNHILISLEPGSHLHPINSRIFVKVHLHVKLLELLQVQFFVPILVQDTPEVGELLSSGIRTLHEAFLIEGGSLYTKGHENIFCWFLKLWEIERLIEIIVWEPECLFDITGSDLIVRIDI